MSLSSYGFKFQPEIRKSFYEARYQVNTTGDLITTTSRYLLSDTRSFVHAEVLKIETVLKWMMFVVNLNNIESNFVNINSVIDGAINDVKYVSMNLKESLSTIENAKLKIQITEYIHLLSVLQAELKIMKTDVQKYGK